MSNGSIGTIPHPVSTALIMTARDLSQQVVGCGAAARGRVVPGGLASSHYRFGRHRVLHLPPLPALPETVRLTRGWQKRPRTSGTKDLAPA